MLALRIRPAARRDLAYIAAYIKLDDVDSALRFRSAVEHELELLRIHPFLGYRRHFRTPGLRSWRISGFEDYLIFYLPCDTSVEIVRVLHGARNLQRILGRPKPGPAG